MELGLYYYKPFGAFYFMLLCAEVYGKSYHGEKIHGSMDFSEILLAQKLVATTPGVCFGDDDAIRLSYALSTEDMLDGLKRIADFVKDCK